MNEILQSVGAPLDLRKFRDRVEEVLGERETQPFRNGGDVPFGARIVDVVCYRVVAGEDSRHEILRDEVVHIDLNRPAQPRYVEVEELIFQR